MSMAYIGESSGLTWGTPGHELLAAGGELRGEEAGKVLLEEAEDEHMAHWRQRRDQNDRKGDEGQQIPGSAPQCLHLQDQETPDDNQISQSVPVTLLWSQIPLKQSAHRWRSRSTTTSSAWGVVPPDMQAAARGCKGAAPLCSKEKDQQSAPLCVSCKTGGAAPHVAAARRPRRRGRTGAPRTTRRCPAGARRA